MAEQQEDLLGSAERRQLFQWHLANIEFSSAMLASKLSLTKWAMDDAFEFGGDHVWLPGGACAMPLSTLPDVCGWVLMVWVAVDGVGGC